MKIKMRQSWPRPGCSRSNEDDSDSEDLYRRELFAYGHFPFEKPDHTKKHKRYRIAFSPEQVIYLENRFKEQAYATGAARSEIAAALNLPEKCIKVWFQNRRSREKNNREKEELSSKTQKLINSSFFNDLSKMPIESKMQIMYTPLTLPLASTSAEIKEKETIADNIQTYRLNYYQDISPEPEQTQFFKGMITKRSPATTTSASDHKSSAEYSIDLCKKYKNLISSFKNENRGAGGHLAVAGGSMVSTSLNDVKGHFPYNTYEQDSPQDLSIKKPKANEHDHQVLKSGTTTCKYCNKHS